LEEAQDASNPLLERIFFLSIVGSNLDEFFMVRVSGLMREVDSGISDEGPDGMSSIEQLEAIRKGVASLLTAAQRCFRRQLLPALESNGIHLLEYAQLTPRQQAKADRYFDDTVLPVLTPLAFDPGHPFPHISNLSLNIAVLIRGVFCPRQSARYAAATGAHRASAAAQKRQGYQRTVVPVAGRPDRGQPRQTVSRHANCRSESVSHYPQCRYGDRR
jgi:polyphosphate kinase